MKDLLLLDTNIPSNFRYATFDDYDTDGDSEHQGSVRVIKKLREWQPTPRRPSLLFVGRPGLAKTMLACATLNEFQALHLPSHLVQRRQDCVLQQNRWPVYFIQLASFVRMHIRLFKLESRMSAGLIGPEECLQLDQLLEDLQSRVKMLVVDDVGKEHRTASGFAIDEFDHLVRSRFNNGLSTIFTTNTPVERWDEQNSESMRNFMERTCTIIEFRGPRRSHL